MPGPPIPGRPAVSCLAAFGQSPMATSPTFTDISNRLTAFTLRRGRSYELNRCETGEATIELRNDDGYLDPAAGGAGVSVYNPIRLTATLAGQSYVLFSGAVERWPETDHDRLRNVYWTRAVAVDGFGIFAGRVLRDYYTETVASLRPTAYYPLTESAAQTGSTSFTETGTPNPLPPVTLAAAQGGATLATPGQPLPLFEMTQGVAFTAAGGGSYIQLPASATPAAPTASQGVTFTCWSRFTANPAQTSTVMSWIDPVNGGYVYFGGGGGTKNAAPNLELSVTASGAVQAVSCLGQSGAANPTVLVGPFIADGRVHALAAVVDPGGPTLRLYVDGVQAASTALPGVGIPTLSPGPVWVGGYPVVTSARPAPYQPGLGTVAHVTTHSAALTASQVSALASAGATGDPVTVNLAGRLNRILNAAGVNVQVNSDGNNINETPTPFGANLGWAGRSLLDVLQDAASDAAGTVYMTPLIPPAYSVPANLGFLQAQGPGKRWTQTTPALVFGDGGGSEIPYQSVGFSLDPQYVYNDVQVTNSGGGGVRTTDATSISAYGQRGYSKTGRWSKDGPAYEQATYTLAAYAQPKVRPTDIVVDIARVTSAAASLLTLDIGTRVQVKRRPFGVNGRVITVDGFVEGIRMDVTPQTWQITVTVSPVPLTVALADSSPSDSTAYVAAF